MRRHFPTAAVVIAALACVIVAAIATLEAVLRSALVRSVVTDAAVRAVGQRVSIASIGLTFHPQPALRLNGIAIRENDETVPFVTLDELVMVPRLRGLLGGHVELTAVVLKHPQFSIVDDRRVNAGRADAAQDADSTRPIGESVGVLQGAHVRLENGCLRYTHLQADGATVDYRLENVTLDAVAGPTVTFAGDAELRPGNLKITTAGRFSLRRLCGDGSAGPDGERCAGHSGASLIPSPGLGKSTLARERWSVHGPWHYSAASSV